MKEYKDTGYFVTIDGLIYNKKKIILRDRISKLGYDRKSLYINGKYKNIFTHRMVYETYIGPIKEGYEINHIDGNKLNNRLSNLECVTKSQNTTHRYYILKKGLKPISLKKDGVIYNFDSIVEASKSLNLCGGNLSRLLNGIKKKYKGFEICHYN